MAQENEKKANALIDEATANTKDVRVLTEAAEALIHYKTKNLDKAKALLDKALAADPKNIECLLLYGDVYAELNNGTLAADYYNRALDLNKSSARAIVSKGRLYKRSTNHEGAAREFENAIATDPNYAPAHRELGDTYFKLGKLNEAKQEYKKYLELSKSNFAARIKYAFALYLSEDYDEAINQLNEAQQRGDSNNLSLLRVQLYVYFKSKKCEQAINTASHLYRMLPPEKRVPSDMEFYGKTFIKCTSDSDSVAMGIDNLQKAFSMDPARTDLLSDLADGYYKLKQYPNVIQLLRQKMANGKGISVIDYYNLSNAYYYNNQFQEADTPAAKVNELVPSYATGWMLRARINSHIDSTSEQGLAKPFYEKYDSLAMVDSTNAVRYQSGLIDAYTYLAYYYLLKKDTANALRYLHKKLPLPLEPDERKNVQQAIDQLEGRAPKTAPKPKK
jgi:tetratricopeptide (TPR) repeat protein